MQRLNIPIRAGIVGFESPAAQYAELSLTLDKLLITNPTAEFVIRVAGDSMTGVGIYDQDLLIVSRAVTAKHGDIVLANVDGNVVCKEVDTKNRCLRSHAEGFPPYYFGDLETLEVYGVVMRCVRLHRPLTKGLVT